jgi:hypothetical protein
LRIIKYLYAISYSSEENVGKSSTNMVRAEMWAHTQVVVLLDTTNPWLGSGEADQVGLPESAFWDHAVLVTLGGDRCRGA